jgi:hypothetical protein
VIPLTVSVSTGQPPMPNSTPCRWSNSQRQERSRRGTSSRYHKSPLLFRTRAAEPKRSRTDRPGRRH